MINQTLINSNDFYKLSDIIDNNVDKNIVFSEWNSKVNRLKTKMFDTSNLINKTQYNNYKQNLEQRVEHVD